MKHISAPLILGLLTHGFFPSQWRFRYFLPALTLAQRARCAAAIFARPAADILCPRRPLPTPPPNPTNAFRAF